MTKDVMLCMTFDLRSVGFSLRKGVSRVFKSGLVLMALSANRLFTILQAAQAPNERRKREWNVRKRDPSLRAVLCFNDADLEGFVRELKDFVCSWRGLLSAACFLVWYKWKRVPKNTARLHSTHNRAGLKLSVPVELTNSKRSSTYQSLCYRIEMHLAITGTVKDYFQFNVLFLPLMKDPTF